MQIVFKFYFFENKHLIGRNIMLFLIGCVYKDIGFKKFNICRINRINELEEERIFYMNHVRVYTLQNLIKQINKAVKKSYKLKNLH